MKRIIIFFALSTTMSLSAQSVDNQVIGSLGGNFVNVDLGVCFTAGESVIGSYATGAITVYQGFHQNSAAAVGLEELSMDEVVTVYPNPARGFVNIQFEPEQDDYSIEIFALNGQRVFNEQVYIYSYDATVQLNIEHLTPGVYQVKMTGTKGNVKRSKFIKE